MFVDRSTISATEGGGARAAVRVQMAARREKQERERAVREEELAWLQEFDAKSTEYKQLGEKLNTRSAEGTKLTSEQMCQASQRLKELDPHNRVGRVGLMPGSGRALEIRHKYFGREIDLKWLAKYDQWYEERGRLIEASRDRSVSTEESNAAAERLKQFDPRWNSSSTNTGGDHKQANRIRKERFRWDQQQEQWVEKRSSKRSEGWVEKKSSRRSATAVGGGSSSDSDGGGAAPEDESSGGKSSGSSIVTN